MPHHRLLAISVATCSFIAAAGPAMAAEPTPTPTPVVATPEATTVTPTPEPTIVAATAEAPASATPTATEPTRETPTPTVTIPVVPTTAPTATVSTPADPAPAPTVTTQPTTAAPSTTAPTTAAPTTAAPTSAAPTTAAPSILPTTPATVTPSTLPTTAAPTAATPTPIATAAPMVYTEAKVQVSCGTDANGTMTLTATVTNIDPRVTDIIFGAQDGLEDQVVQLAEGQTTWTGSVVVEAGGSTLWDLTLGSPDIATQVETGQAQCTVDPLDLQSAQISFRQDTCGVPGMPVTVTVTATNPNDREVVGTLITQSNPDDRAEKEVTIPAHGSVSVQVQAGVEDSLFAGVAYASGADGDPADIRESFRATTFDVDQCTEEAMPEVDAVAVCRPDGKANLTVSVTNPADISKYLERYIVVAGVGQDLDEQLIDVADGGTSMAHLVVPVGDIEIVVASTRTGEETQGFLRGVSCTPIKPSKPKPGKPAPAKPAKPTPTKAKPAPAKPAPAPQGDGGKGSDGPGLASTGEGI